MFETIHDVHCCKDFCQVQRTSHQESKSKVIYDLLPEEWVFYRLEHEESSVSWLVWECPRGMHQGIRDEMSTAAEDKEGYLENKLE